jgi:hypothetical protein
VSTPEEMKPKKKSEMKKKNSTHTETSKPATADSNTVCTRREKPSREGTKKCNEQPILLPEKELLDHDVSRRPSDGLVCPSLPKNSF